MGLPWVRLDSNIATHDKILALLDSKRGANAFVLYVCSLAWSGGQSTDGIIPRSALAINHGTVATANQLVDVGLFEHDGPRDYRVRNWAIRQELAITTEIKRAANAAGGRKSACRRWHGPDCGCWVNEA